jgi:hypothetical protein
MAVELIDCPAILFVIRRFHGMGDANSCLLRSESHARVHHYVRRSICVPFQRFGGMCTENFCDIFLLLFVARWVPIFVVLCKRAVPKLWHASLFLGLRHVGVLPP